MANTEDDMDKPVTRRELHEVLGIWGAALEARIDTKLGALEARLDAKLDAKLEMHTDRLSAELARHTERILDETRKMVAVGDEKYGTLPDRVAVLEAKDKQYEDLPARVEALEAKASPPKRQRRR